MRKKLTAATLTLNPALDRTMYFDGTFRAGQLNRARDTVTTLGSKGINVSRCFKKYGVDAVAYGFYGGDPGRQMLSMLSDEGITCRLTETKAPTRINIKMIDADEVCTEANEKGGPISTDELEALIREMELSTDNTEFFALGGSIPPPVEKSVYKDIITRLKKRGARVALDCDGEALRLGLEARPELIKPNLAELSELIGFTPNGVEDTANECRRLFVENRVCILCTMSENGAVYAGDEGVFIVNTPKVEMRGFTGAGDTFLTSFIYEKAMTENIPRALEFAAAAAGAKVTLPGSGMPERAYAESFLPMVKAKKIY